MIAYILAAVGGYLIGDSLKGQQYARGGYMAGGSLDKLYRFNEYGVKSFRDLINQGVFVGKFKTIENASDFDRIKYNRMRGAEQLKYVKKLNKKINKYNLEYKDGSFTAVPKEVYDYADVPESPEKNYYTLHDEPKGYIWKEGGNGFVSKGDGGDVPKGAFREYVLYTDDQTARNQKPDLTIFGRLSEAIEQARKFISEGSKQVYIKYRGTKYGNKGEFHVCTVYEDKILNPQGKSFRYADGGGIQQAPNQEYLKWFKDWYKKNYNDIFIAISLPNEISSPITEAGETNVIIDVIQKNEDGVNAKKYLEQLVNKADELGVTLHLVPKPRTENLKSESHKKKITKDYLISYYEKFGFKKVADDHMVREPKDISRMAKGGKIETYAVYPQRIVNIAKPAGEELYTTDFKATFRVVGTLDDAEAQAQKFVRENEAMYPFVVVKKIHPSGNPLKNKNISRVEKDKITKL